MSREKYVLIFWLEDPRSVDVILKTKVVPDDKFPLILPQQERKAVWDDGKPYPGRILATETKGSLLKLKVSRDGEILTECGPTTEVVTSRRKAIAILESRASKDRLAAVDQLDQLVLVAAIPTPAVPPVERSADDRAETEAALARLPCRQPPPEVSKEDYVELGPKLWVQKEDLHYILRRHKRRPVKMFRSLLRLLLTADLLKEGALSESGRGGTAKIPEDIVKKSLSYTSLNSTGKDFDVGRTISNMMGDFRQKKRTGGEAVAEDDV